MDNTSVDSFGILLQLAKEGDNQAMEQIIHRFEPDMQRLASFIRMPREESVQHMKAAFIEMLRDGERRER